MNHRFSIFLLAIALSATSALAQAPAYRVEFSQEQYNHPSGVAFQTPVRINPLPPAGLFSYGLICTVEGANGLVGTVSLTPSSTLAFDGIVGPGSRGVAAEPGRFFSKGSTDFFAPEKPVHTDSQLGTLTVAGLPAGTYTLRLAPYNTLGPTESLFVDGQCRSLDPQLAFGIATLTIASRPQATVTAVGPMKPDRQTGLLTQDYEVKNTGPATTSPRIFIKNLPANVTVWNAHGTIDGIPYFDLASPLAAGDTAKITIEYRSQDRATIPDPQFEIGQAGDKPPDPVGDPVAFQQLVKLSDGSMLVEFNSEAGKDYHVQYTGDSAVWKTALPKIDGTGNRILWIDNGAPKTESHPSAAAGRTYRILVTQPAK